MEAFVSQSAETHLYSSAFGDGGKNLQQVTHVCTWEKEFGTTKTSWYPSAIKMWKEIRRKQ